MNGIKICGTGCYLPKREVTNDDLAKMVDTNDEWISTRTGIRTRHVAAGEDTALMAERAARPALEMAGVKPEEIDLLICTTVTPDLYTPSLACVVQGLLGIGHAFAFDVSAACSGFVFALDIVQKYLAAGIVKTALIISAEALTRITDFTDRASCVLFGDGAGACVVRAGEGRYAAHLCSDGSGVSMLYAGTSYPLTPFESEEARKEGAAFETIRDGFLHMDGKGVYKFAVEAMPQAILDACETLGVQPEELGLIVPHQANIRIIQTAMKRLGLSMDRAYVNIGHIGNTSSATVPIALDEANREGLLHEGELVALTGFGAGLTYGAAVFEW